MAAGIANGIEWNGGIRDTAGQLGKNMETRILMELVCNL